MSVLQYYDPHWNIRFKNDIDCPVSTCESCLCQIFENFPLQHPANSPPWYLHSIEKVIIKKYERHKSKIYYSENRPF